MPIIAPTVTLNNGFKMPILGLGTYAVSLQSTSVKLAIVNFHPNSRAEITRQ